MWIHSSQIQSFLNLGVCKEYLIMPKPKNAKKNTPVAEPVVSTDLATPGTDSIPTNKTAAPVPNREELNPQAKAREEKSADFTAAVPKKIGKPEIVKSDSRSNLVPINLEDEIRRLAYLLSERRGFQPGYENEDWLKAEREVLDRYHQQSA
jgi:hypothetical protein